MSQFFCLAVRFMQPSSHGRGDGGEPEWPPSPLRLFQAILAAAAGRWNERSELKHAVAALEWLEQQDVPTIVAADVTQLSGKYRLYVPGNAADELAASWCRGGDKTIAEFRTEKDVQAVKLNADSVYYVFEIQDRARFDLHRDVLFAAMRSITHLGWGVDMVVGYGTELSVHDAERLPGTRWLSNGQAAISGHRVPTTGTLAALMHKHEAFLNRTQSGHFSPVPPLTRFRVVRYRQATDPTPKCHTAFRLLKPDGKVARVFDTCRNARTVAGMMRHAVASAARRNKWNEERINIFVHGKTADGKKPASGERSPNRFQYLPLPTVNHGLSRIESIQRIMIAAPDGYADQVAWAQRVLADGELTNEEGKVIAILGMLPASDWVMRQYVQPSYSWTTVTPLILPRHDGYELDKAGKIIRVAFEQAGYDADLIAQAEIDWQRVGFCNGVDLASRYLPPENLGNKPRYHVRIRFPRKIAGPITIGSGRFRGFGLFVSAD